MPRTLKTILKLDMSKFKAGLRDSVIATKQFERSIARPLGGAIKRVAKLTAMFGVLAAAVVGGGVKMAGNIEMLRARLENISAGPEDFAQGWKDATKVFLTSPLELGETIESLALLKAVGLGGEQALRDIGGAAVAMGRDVKDVALAVNSMHPKVLRRLGIEARKTGDAFTFNFRDRAGKAMTTTTKGIEEARKAALKIMRIKFGGSLAKMALTWEGAMSTFRGAAKMGIAQLFDPLKNTLIPILKSVNDWLVKMVTSGGFKEWGVQISAAALFAARGITTLIKAIKSFDFKAWALQNLDVVVAMGAGFAMIFGGKMIGAISALMRVWMALPSAFQGVLGAITALVAGWRIGKFLEERFNLSNIVAGWMLSLQTFAKNAIVVFNRLRGKLSETEADALINANDKALADMKQSLKDQAAAAKEAMDFGKTGEEPDWLAKMRGKFDTALKDAINIQTNADMAGIKEGVGDGVARGLKARDFGKLFLGGDKQERRLAFGKDRRDANKQLNETKNTNALLTQMREAGALVF